MRATTIAALAICVLLATAASAHRADLIVSGRRAGPIRLGETTLRDVERWFGETSRERRRRYQCIRVIAARWDDDLRILFSTEEDRPTVVAKVRRRTMRSSEHGTLSFHTRKGLRVGDPERRVRRLYPRADSQTHRGHTHYIVRSSPRRGRLLVKVVDGRVVELEVGPYEAC